MEDFSKRLREAMEFRNFRQVDLVNATKLDKGAISNYLSGKYRPKSANAVMLARALNVNELWLMGYDVPMEIDPYVDYSHDDKEEEENKGLMTYEYKEGFEKEITKEKWCEFYDKIKTLPDSLQLDVFKSVVLMASMADMLKEKMKNQ